MTTPDFEWDCYHCGQRCGGRLASGYGALTGEFTPDGAIHASCHPDDPAEHPDCWRRVIVYRERPGALRGWDPLPAGIEDIRP
jgi:hypothetical protein